MERINPNCCPIVPRIYCNQIFESIAGTGNYKINGCGLIIQWFEEHLDENEGFNLKDIKLFGN